MTEPRQIERTLLIDADDTLWENNIFYERCIVCFQDYMAALGADRVLARTTLDECERETIPLLGYSPHGFMKAMGMACERLLCGLGREASGEEMAQASRCGQMVLAPPMVLIEGVTETLQLLRATSRLILVTKGDETVQCAKLERSGLGPLFDASVVLVEKDPASYRHILTAHALDPRQSWMIGNSPRSDINPAVEAGLGAVFIPHDHTWIAEIEAVAHPEAVVTLTRFTELARFFGIGPT